MNEKSLIAEWLDKLPEDLRYEFEERAGIMEFDGGSSRHEAERGALILLFERHALRVSGLHLFWVREGEYLLTIAPETSVVGAMTPVSITEFLRELGGSLLLRVDRK
jgi:hypothetical protein